MIIQCTTKDLDKLQRISVATFKETFAADNKTVDMEKYLATAFHPDQLKRELENKSSKFYFAYDEDELAGYLKVKIEIPNSSKSAAISLEIERIYVLQKFQKAGFGKLLMEKALDIAAQHQVAKVWLGVWEENKQAIDFYERLVFVKTGHHYFQLGDDQQKDYIMTLHLNRVNDN